MAAGTVQSKRATIEKSGSSGRASAVEEMVPTPALVNESPTGISLSQVGVKFRLLTEDQRTLKGRVLGMFGAPESAEFWALRNLTLEIRRGDVLGIMGSNGSGKSTLMRVMGRIIDPTEGSVDVRGQVSAMLELGGAFNPELTGRENAYLVGALHRIPRDQMTAMMSQIQAMAEIGPFFDVPLKTYSTGMVSRLAFSLAAQAQPDILLIDEVFAVGDENFQRKSSIRMRKMIEQGSIIVLVSHSHALLRQICNRLIWIDRGTLMEDGSPNQVSEAYLRHASR